MSSSNDHGRASSFVRLRRSVLSSRFAGRCAKNGQRAAEDNSKFRRELSRIYVFDTGSSSARMIPISASCKENRVLAAEVV
jgi:hypothetical protein